MNLTKDQVLKVVQLHQQYEEAEFIAKVTEKFPEISAETAATLDKVIAVTLDQLIEMVEGLVNVKNL